jgi:hypothetical protein
MQLIIAGVKFAEVFQILKKTMTSTITRGLSGSSLSDEEISAKIKFMQVHKTYKYIVTKT